MGLMCSLEKSTSGKCHLVGISQEQLAWSKTERYFSNSDTLIQYPLFEMGSRSRGPKMSRVYVAIYPGDDGEVI